MKASRQHRICRPFSSLSTRTGVVSLGLAILWLVSVEPVQAQRWEGVSFKPPRQVAWGAVSTAPLELRGLRTDRFYSLILTGAIKLGQEHYGNYYKGYYGDAAFRWESRASDANFPTQAPLRPGVVSTNPAVAFQEDSCRADHVYHTGWFLPQSETLTIVQTTRPYRDNRGQIFFSLVEMHPAMSPDNYVFNPSSANWNRIDEFMGRQPQGFASGSPVGVASSGPDQGVDIDTNLFSANYGRPMRPGMSSMPVPPPFPDDDPVSPPGVTRRGPADTFVAPGFSPARTSQVPTRRTPPPNVRIGNSNAGPVELLGVSAPRVP